MNSGLVHPLTGSSAGHLVRLVRENAPVSASALPRLALALGSAVGRLPFRPLERARLGALRPDDGELLSPPPVFIVGHWRSGTTHLYNLLSRAPRFGYVTPLATGLPGEFLTLGALIRPFLDHLLPSDRLIDRVAVDPDSPQEDEAALANLQPLSFYHGIFFPRQLRRHFRRGVFFDGCSEAQVRRWEESFLHFLEKVAVQQDSDRLLVKNPVYTARVARLRSLLPGSKFVHIYRNPFVVYQSTRSFYDALLEELSLQAVDDPPVDELILDSYPRIMSRLLEDADDVPDGDVVHVRYEDLDREPMTEARRIFEELELPGFERERERFERYLRSVADYRKNRYEFPDEVVETVRDRWGRFVDRWGYEPPA